MDTDNYNKKLMDTDNDKIIMDTDNDNKIIMSRQ